MKIVGEAEVEDVLVDEPETIWKKQKQSQELIKIFLINTLTQIK